MGKTMTAGRGVASLVADRPARLSRRRRAGNVWHARYPSSARTLSGVLVPGRLAPPPQVEPDHGRHGRSWPPRRRPGVAWHQPPTGGTRTFLRANRPCPLTRPAHSRARRARRWRPRRRIRHGALRRTVRPTRDQPVPYCQIPGVRSLGQQLLIVVHRADPPIHRGGPCQDHADDDHEPRDRNGEFKIKGEEIQPVDGQGCEEDAIDDMSPAHRHRQRECRNRDEEDLHPVARGDGQAYELRNAARALSDNDEPRTRAPSSNIHPATPPPTMMRIAVSTPG